MSECTATTMRNGDGRATLNNAPLKTVLSRLDGKRRPDPHRHQYEATCPVCGALQDLAVGVGEDGRVLLHCFHDCPLDEIVAAIGLTVADLFPRSASVRPKRPPPNSASLPADQNWVSRAERYAKGLTTPRLGELSANLKLPQSSFKPLGIGYDPATSSYTFPERNATGGVVGIVRRYPNGAKKSESGSRRGLTLPDDVQRLPDPVLIVEGASCAAACVAMGLAAIGRPQASIGGELAEQLATVIGPRDCIVVGEFDPKSNGSWPGKEGAIATAERLAAKLGRPVLWALPPDGMKDIRAWAIAQKPKPPEWATLGKRLLGYLRANAVTVNPLNTLAMLSDLEICNRPPPSFLIEDILVAGSLAILCGRPGDGKTFIALDMGLCVTDGCIWQDFNVKRGWVLFIAAEGIGGLPPRVQAWRKFNAIANGLPVGAKFLCEPVQLLDADEVERLIAALKGDPPAMIVIDTLARCIVGGDENSSMDMGLAVAACDRIRQATGATVLLVHHLAKHIAVERGSSALRGACDTLMLVNKASDGTITLTCEKQKDAAPFPPIHLRLHEVALPSGATSCVVEAAAATLDTKCQTALAQLKKLCSGTRSKTGVSATTWWHKTGLKKRTFERAKTTLIRGKYVKKVGKLFVPLK